MIARVLRLAIAATLLAALSACAPGADLRPVPPYSPAVYRLGTDDEVRVVTYGEDQLTLDYRIDAGGNIAFPLIGIVHAEGLTTQQLAATISAELQRKKMLSNASVSVEISAYRPISILGEVVKPGQYPYQPGMTVLTAVAAAGGFTYRAFEDYARVTRNEGGQAVIGRLEPQGYVKPNDVLKIYERVF